MTEPSLAVVLTEQESTLLSKIELDPLALTGDEFYANGDLIDELLKLLKARRGIPAYRISWFTDPDYNAGGRGRSRYNRFTEQHEDNVPNHPNFLKTMKYFLYGPDLPVHVMKEFLKEVSSCGQVTSGDIAPLSKVARRLARENGLLGECNADEFFKLSLECGMSATYGIMIRNTVMTVR